MKDRYFIDTNILVYSFDNENSHKRNIALNLISEALTQSTGIVSYQVFIFYIDKLVVVKNI